MEGAEAEKTEEHCFLAYSSWFAQIALIHNSGTPAEGSTTYQGLSSPTSIINNNSSNNIKTIAYLLAHR